MSNTKGTRSNRLVNRDHAKGTTGIFRKVFHKKNNKKGKSKKGKITPVWDECNFDNDFMSGNLNLKHHGKISDFYEMKSKELGTGSFGTVTLASHKATGQLRAIKTVPKYDTTPSEQFELENEMRLLQKLSHPNILQLVEYFETKDDLYIVTDVYEGGELFDEILSRKEFTEVDVSTIISQLLSCLAYLKEKKIVHRDIKPENIMLEKSKDFSAIKLIDFGHSVEFDPEKDALLTEKIGTPYYIAPEVLNRRYDHKCDLWSVGVITYILLVGYPPFNGNDNAAIFKRVLTGKYTLKKEPWPSVSRDAKEFVRELLTVNYDERLEAKHALEQPFIVNEGVVFKQKSRTKARSRKSKNKSKRGGGSSIGSRARSASSGVSKVTSTLGTIMRPVGKLGGSSFEKTKAMQAIKNLREFNYRDKLRHLVYGYAIAQCMPKTKREEIAKVFKEWDLDSDGLLSRDELDAALRKHAPQMLKLTTVDDLFFIMDSDGSGYVEYQEFLVAVSNPEHVMTKENLKTVFSLLDKDGDGFISLDELKAAVQNDDVSDDVLNSILDNSEENSDGTISLEEFVERLSVE